MFTLTVLIHITVTQLQFYKTSNFYLHPQDLKVTPKIIQNYNQFIQYCFVVFFFGINHPTHWIWTVQKKMTYYVQVKLSPHSYPFLMCKEKDDQKKQKSKIIAYLSGTLHLMWKKKKTICTTECQVNIIFFTSAQEQYWGYSEKWLERCISIKWTPTLNLNLDQKL